MHTDLIPSFGERMCLVRIVHAAQIHNAGLDVAGCEVIGHALDGEGPECSGPDDANVAFDVGDDAGEGVRDDGDERQRCKW